MLTRPSRATPAWLAVDRGLRSSARQYKPSCKGNVSKLAQARPQANRSPWRAARMVNHSMALTVTMVSVADTGSCCGDGNNRHRGPLTRHNQAMARKLISVNRSRLADPSHCLPP